MTATLTFFDNFSTLSLWNGASGTWDTNYWYNSLSGDGGSLPSNGEQEWYINSNDPATSSIRPWTVSNGILTITANPAPAAIQPLIDNYQYTSGELNTYHSFSQTYGYFEMRAELPAGQGLWPAFWMLPENGSWPPELDILEQLGSNPSEIYTTVHSGTTAAEVSSGVGTSVVNTSTSYNDYAVSWTASTITWFFNGVQVYQTATPAGMNVPMYLELNLAVGGDWGGAPNSTTPFPAAMEVAYVAAYSSDPDPNPTSTTFTANNTAGQVLQGAAGNDIFYAGTNSVVMTGDGETNSYIYAALPTSYGQITDFDPAVDTINLSTLLQSVGYKGTNPFTDGTLSLVSDGKSGAYLEYEAPGSSTAVIIVELDNVAPSTINTSTDFIISGSAGGSAAGSAGGSVPGVTLTANDTAGQVLTATAPNSTFYAEQNSVIMTEDGGSNTFVFAAMPYNAGQITNFHPATDSINLVALLHLVDYTGTSPFSDGTLTLVSDGHGGTDVFYNPPGAGSNGVWPTTIVDLDNVAPSAIVVANDFITSASATPSGGSSGGASAPGQTLTANDTAGQVLTATAPNSIFYAEQNSVVMTEDGGSNTFVFTASPYNAGQITNFNPVSDTINLAALLQAEGYKGTSPFVDGTLSVTSDSHNGTDIDYQQSASSTVITIVDLDNVLPSAINVTKDFITSSSGTNSGSSGSGTAATGETLTANNTPGQSLTATSPGATFYAEQNSVVMTEAGGSNTFVFSALPYNAGQITDFSTTSDTINLTALLKSVGYAGTSPFSDGTLALTSDGHGGTDVFYNPPGAGSNGIWPITIVDLDNVAPSAIAVGNDFITSAGATGSAAGGSGTAATNETLTANNTPGQILTAISPSVTFYAEQNSVVMTEDGGSNTFVFSALPYNAGQITDFSTTSDTINLTALLKSVGYAGTSPFSDGTLALTSDGHGGTDVFYNPPGAGSNGIWPITIVDLDNVAPSAISVGNDFITSAGATGSAAGVSGTAATNETLTANNTPGQILTAISPSVTFYAEQNSVVMTEDGGSNTFVFSALPYNAGQITNFNPAEDVINLKSLFQSVGYAGANPFGDGTLTLSSDGKGGTDIYYHASSTSIPITIVDLEHVALVGVNLTTDFIFH